MPYDYAPRLAALARIRKRRHTLFTICLLALPALSFQSVSGVPETSAASSLQVAQTQP